jgi:ParB/RepB/Spo0J family partition protein
MILELKEIKDTQIYIRQNGLRISRRCTDDEMLNLVEHIKIHGILEPLVVFAVDDLTEDHELYESRKDFKGKYEILSGERRFNASIILNREFPGEGWDKIPCLVKEAPDNETDVKSIFLGSILTHSPRNLEEIITECDNLFKMYNDEAIVSKKTGISRLLIRKYVKFARLPKLLQDNLGSITKNPKSAINLALDAADALCWSKDGDVSEETVLELAKALGDAKRDSPDRYKKLKQTAEENPKESMEIIEEKSSKMTSPKEFRIILDGKFSSTLEKLAEENGYDPSEQLVELFEKFLISRSDDD